MTGVDIHNGHPMFQTSGVTRQIMQALFYFQPFVCIAEQAFFYHKNDRDKLLLPLDRPVNIMVHVVIPGKALK